MTLLLPGTLLILIGGSYADRFGGRRVAAIAQGFAALAILFLIAVLVVDSLSYTAMLVYGVMMGCAVAFVTPARDGLLSHALSITVPRSATE